MFERGPPFLPTRLEHVSAARFAARWHGRSRRSTLERPSGCRPFRRAGARQRGSMEPRKLRTGMMILLRWAHSFMPPALSWCIWCNRVLRSGRTTGALAPATQLLLVPLSFESTDLLSGGSGSGSQIAAVRSFWSVVWIWTSMP